MTIRIASAVLLAATSLAGAAQPQTSALDVGSTGCQISSNEDEVDRYVLAEMKRQQIPGLSLVVVKDRRVVKARGYGLANVEHDVAATEHTIYQSGSVGKQFTAAAILLLAEGGKLGLDDRITKYFPNAPSAWRDISIRHLLTHTSGIKNYTDGALDMRRDYKDDELVALAMKPPLDFTPGTRWSYSNTGYVLLGVIITKVSGTFYGNFLADRIFTPLGMATARIISEADIVKHRAAGYHLVKGELKNQDWVSPALNTTGDGSLHVTALDLVKWETALAGSTFLSAESRREWWTPVKLTGSGSFPYGMGWSLDFQRDRRSIGHGGSWQGFKTHIQRYPDDGLTVVVLANLAQARQSAIAYAVAGFYNPALTPPHRLEPKADDPRTADLLKRFVEAFATGESKDAAPLTPGFASIATAEDRKQSAAMLKAMTSFTFVGCDAMGRVSVERHGAAVDRYCHVKVELPTGGRAVTFWLTKDEKIAGFTGYAY